MAATTRVEWRGIFAHRSLRPTGAATALIVTATLLAGCSTEGTDEPPSLNAASGSAVSTDPTTSSTPTPSTAPTPALDVGPFAGHDLEDLVLRADEGEGLVDGLSYSVSYSGSADIGDVHHWTLVPTNPLEAAGFIEAYSGMFMTPAFPGTFAREGRSLATAVLLFHDPQGAHRGLGIFRSTRAETWEVWEPLTMRGGFGTIGRLGSDNVSVVYPTVGFMGRVGNVIVMVGSQGGSDEGRPLAAALVRRIAYDLRARARALLARGANAVSVASCPDGSNPDAPGPADQARPEKGLAPIAFDRLSGKLVLLEPSWTARDGASRTWTLDVCTNTWQLMDPPKEPMSEALSRLVYDADSDLTVLFTTTEVWAYDVDADVWTTLGATSVPHPQAVHDSVSGLVIVRNATGGDMYRFEAEDGAWAEIEQRGEVPPTTDGSMHGQVMTYDPTIDRLVLYVEGHRCCPATWLFDPRSGTWAKTGAQTPRIEFVFGDLVNGGEIAFDESTSRTVILSGLHRYSFDASTMTWQTEPTGLGRRFGVRLAYDPLNERLIMVSDEAVHHVGRFGGVRPTLALDVAMDRWSILVSGLRR